MEEDEECHFDRKNQIQTEVNNFYDKLDLAAKRYADTSQEDSIENKKDSRSSSPSSNLFHKKLKKKKLVIKGNMFDPPPPWRCNKLASGDFDKMKFLGDCGSYPTPWEISRAHMSRRSYEKGENTLDKRGFVCRNLFSSDFDNPYKINNNLSTLGSVGNKIISKFIKENEKREEIYRQKEEEYYEYLHSKHEPNYNVWRCSHPMEYFSIPPADKIVSYRKEKKPKRITTPFRPTRLRGTFFDKLKPLY